MLGASQHKKSHAENTTASRLGVKRGRPPPCPNEGSLSLRLDDNRHSTCLRVTASEVKSERQYNLFAILKRCGSHYWTVNFADSTTMIQEQLAGTPYINRLRGDKGISTPRKECQAISTTSSSPAGLPTRNRAERQYEGAYTKSVVSRGAARSLYNTSFTKEPVFDDIETVSVDVFKKHDWHTDIYTTTLWRQNMARCNREKKRTLVAIDPTSATTGSGDMGQCTWYNQYNG
ncbi:hypothetical protein ACLB2K_072975 [Fragaria x ananassa]